MREVLFGCEYCGKRMLTDGNPLTYRSCDACKAKHRREGSRRQAADRKARRHAFKAAMGVPRCELCGKTIEGVVRLTLVKSQWQWARKFCGNTCRQAAFRART
jgi:hypothetical protein